MKTFYHKLDTWSKRILDTQRTNQTRIKYYVIVCDGGVVDDKVGPNAAPEIHPQEGGHKDEVKEGGHHCDGVDQVPQQQLQHYIQWTVNHSIW